MFGDAGPSSYMSQPALLPYDPSDFCCHFSLLPAPLHTPEDRKMASGVNVSDEVKNIFSKMKIVKSDANHCDRIRLVTFKIDGDTINVEKMFMEKDLTGKDVFQEFVAQLEPMTCRYILYDCHYETKESPKEDIVFAMWVPSEAKLKDKMHYASSKEAIKKVLTGVKHNVELHDLGDCGTRREFVEILGKNVVKLECVACGCGS